MGCYHLLFSFMCPISLICWQTLSVCFSLVALSALQKEKKEEPMETPVKPAAQPLKGSHAHMSFQCPWHMGTLYCTLWCHPPSFCKLGFFLSTD